MPAVETESTAEVPVWVSGSQKWVTGATRKTTCEDVVRALLKAEQDSRSDLLFPAPVPDPRHYAIVERWRKMERVIDPHSRILKAWHAWGDQRFEIKFHLKRVEPLTPRSVKTARHRPSSRRSNCWRHANASPSEDHPSKLSENIETLMKMILAQGETIRAQLTRLHDNDDDGGGGGGGGGENNDDDAENNKGDVDEREDSGDRAAVGDGDLNNDEASSPRRRRGHVARRPSARRDANVESRSLPRPRRDVSDEPRGLKAAVKHSSLPQLSHDPDEHNGNYFSANKNGFANSACRLTDATGPRSCPPPDVDACVRAYEDVLSLCLRLEKEEERINRLTLKLQRESDRDLAQSGGGSDLLDESEAELAAIKRLNDDLNSEIERNDRTMADMGLVLRDKQLYLDALHVQLVQAERDSDYLQAALESLEDSSSSSTSSSRAETAASPQQQQQQPPPPLQPPVVVMSSTSRVIATKGILKNKGTVVTTAGTTTMSTSTSTSDTKDPQLPSNRDADSDTGLSSLHSSSDEAQYALDTLV